MIPLVGAGDDDAHYVDMHDTSNEYVTTVTGGIIIGQRGCSS